MARFVDDESRNKRGGQEMDISHWPRFNYQNVPHQRNGIDCGKMAKGRACLLALSHSKRSP